MATTSASRPGPVEPIGTGGAAATPKQFRIEFNTANLVRFRSAWFAILRRDERSSESSPSTNGAARGMRTPWYEYDLRELSPEEAACWYENFLVSDRRQQISAARGPGMRCAAILFSEERADLIWSVHPEISASDRNRVLDEVAENYGREILCVELSGAGEKAAGTAISEDDGLIAVQAEPKKDNDGHSAVSPANARLREIESQLLEVWSAVLRLEITKTDEDFFTAGGHSLLAAKLLARIEAATGVELPIASLLDSPTVEKQARLILVALNSAEASAAPAEPVPASAMQNSAKPVAVTRETAVESAAPDLTAQAAQPTISPKPEKRGQEFFLLGGDPTFRPLSQCLAAMRPFHSLGLQATVIATLGQAPSLAQLAEYFVNAILERQPEGPYALGGWCAHGLLSLEVAQQLAAGGKRVTKLVMLETANPVRLYAYSSWRRAIARRQLKWHLFRFECLYVRHLGWKRAADYLRARIAKKWRKTWLVRSASANGNGSSAGFRLNPLEVLYRAAAEYVPRPYDGPVLLVRGTERTIGFAANEQFGWDIQWMTAMEVRKVPGNHYTIYMPPNVENLANEIDGYIGRAD